MKMDHMGENQTVWPLKFGAVLTGLDSKILETSGRSEMTTKTLYDKIVDLHTIEKLSADGIERLVYIDRTVVNEYTSPQAFSLLRENGLKVWRPWATLGTVDHVNSSAPDRTEFPAEENACTQVKYLIKNGSDFGFEVLNNGNPKQGIEHVVMVERSKVLPGMQIGAGDSHTAMYGALGAVAYGIGTSDMYHYLATSTLRYKKLKNMRVRVTGARGKTVTAKDIILFIVKKLGAGGCTGHCVEFCGPVISDLSVEERLTLCNMAVECAARSSIIAPDQKVFDYLEGREFAPKGETWSKAVEFWKTLKSDEEALFDKEVEIDITGLEPSVTWGTSPDQNCTISESIRILFLSQIRRFEPTTKELWPTWVLKQDKKSKDFRLRMPSSVPALTPESRISEPQPKS